MVWCRGSSSSWDLHEDGDRCCPCRPGTPAVPSIRFVADLRRSKTRARPSIRSRRQLTSVIVPLASFCSDRRAFFGRCCLVWNAQPNDTGLLGARARALLASASDPAARCTEVTRGVPLVARTHHDRGRHNLPSGSQLRAGSRCRRRRWWMMDNRRPAKHGRAIILVSDVPAAPGMVDWAPIRFCASAGCPLEGQGNG